MQIEQLVPAEPGWKAVFKEADGGETMSRLLGWAVAEGGAEVAGAIVDPADPARIVPAPSASSPGGGAFNRYRFVAPEPLVISAPAPAKAAADDEPEPQEAAKRLAKSVLKRRL